MRSEKIGFLYKSPEGEYDWDAHIDPGLTKELEDLEKNETRKEEDVADEIVRLLGDQGNPDELNEHVESSIQKRLSTEDESGKNPQKEAHDEGRTDEVIAEESNTQPKEELESGMETVDADFVEAEPTGETIDGDNKDEAENEDVEPVPVANVSGPILTPGIGEEPDKENKEQKNDEKDEKTKTLKEAPNIRVDLAKFDDFTQKNFTKIDRLLRSPIAKEEGSKAVASLSDAKSILLNVGYKERDVLGMEREDVVVLAKQWIYARRAGDTNLYTRDLEKATVIVSGLDNLAYKTMLSDRQRDNYRRVIARESGLSGTKLERVLNFAITIEDSEKGRLQHLFFDVIKEDGGLATGAVENYVVQDKTTVRDLLVQERLGNIKISSMLNFLHTAGVEVRPDTLWGDVVDKKNMVFLQMLVDKKNINQVLLMDPRAREESVKQLRKIVWGTFMKKEGGRVLPKDPAIDELDRVATDFLTQFGSFGNNNRGKALIRGYLNNYRDYLESRYTDLKFNNSRPGVEREYGIQDIEQLIWNEARFWYQNKDQGEGKAIFNASLNKLGVPKSVDQIISEAVEAGRITKEEGDAWTERRATIKSLMRLSNGMFGSEELSDQMVNEATNYFDKEGAFLNLIEMPVVSGGTRHELADVVAYWDHVMIRGQKDFDYCDIWSKQSLDAVARNFGGNEVAARLARDIYFITGGAARYETTLKKCVQDENLSRSDPGFYRAADPSNPKEKPNYQKQSKGKVNFRDLYMFPFDFGESSGLPEYRNILRDGFNMGGEVIPGVDLYTGSFWDEPRKIKRDEIKENRRAEYNNNPYETWASEVKSVGLTSDLVKDRIRLMGKSNNSTFAGWLGYMKGAQGALKAEKAFMTADRNKMIEKYNELFDAYGYLRGGRKGAYYKRAACYLEYVCRRNTVKGSGTTTTIEEMAKLFLEPTEGRVSPDDYQKLYRKYSRDRRIPKKYSKNQVTPTTLEAIKDTHTLWEGIKGTWWSSLLDIIKKGTNS